MPLEEPAYNIRSIDEIEYGKEIAGKIQLIRRCTEQVEQNHRDYFDEIKRPISNFIMHRRGKEFEGMETFVSGDLRPDIAQELIEVVKKVWAS
ncbi:hypothetical protein GCM10027422_15480 [Hymenobacter arcticus]